MERAPLSLPVPFVLPKQLCYKATLHTHSAGGFALFHFFMARECSSENESDFLPLASVNPKELPVFGVTDPSALPIWTRTT